MINLANAIGRVMMTAVNLPRSTNTKDDAMRLYAETEFRKDDQAYVIECLKYKRPIRVK